jgi:hypothetical protein
MQGAPPTEPMIGGATSRSDRLAVPVQRIVDTGSARVAR